MLVSLWSHLFDNIVFLDQRNACRSPCRLTRTRILPCLTTLFSSSASCPPGRVTFSVCKGQHEDQEKQVRVRVRASACECEERTVRKGKGGS